MAAQFVSSDPFHTFFSIVYGTAGPAKDWHRRPSGNMLKTILVGYSDVNRNIDRLTTFLRMRGLTVPPTVYTKTYPDGTTKRWARLYLVKEDYEKFILPVRSASLPSRVGAHLGG